jgi:uncharacterized protein (TIGR00369 family)
MPAIPTPAESTDATATALARWEAEEAAVRARLADAGVARPEQLAGLSGLEIFEAMARGDLPHAPISDAADIWPIAFSRGHFVYQGRPSARHFNPMGSVHGGWIATLLDSALGCAVQTTLSAEQAYTTAELKVSYVRAVTPALGLVRAEAQVINAGRQLGFAEARLVGPDGRLYAHATTTCLVFARR